jgi:PKD repeat protein
LFRINDDPAYSTFPAGAFGSYPDAASCTSAGGKLYTGGVCYFDANSAPDGTYTKAVWIDVDLACGQCHGGGTATKTTKGNITAGSKTLTVSNGNNMYAGNPIRITGAGALGADFDTYISSVAGNTITLVGKASTTVTNKTVVEGPTKNGAGYMTKAQLAGYADGMHNDSPVASFYYVRDAVNPLKVDVNAAASTCNETCNRYTWDWGDGSPTSSGVTSTHTYATPGTKTITLTVTEYGVGTGTASQNVNVYVADLLPTVAGTCSWDANTWTMTLTDASTDDNGISTIRVTWGDGSLTANGPANTVFTHTYVNPGAYTVTHKAYDTAMQEATRTCSASAAYFKITGKVTRSNGTTPAPSATVKLTGNGVNKTVYTNIAGNYTLANLKPGTYTVTVTKNGYTFPAGVNVSVGGDKVNDVIAVTP